MLDAKDFAIGTADADGEDAKTFLRRFLGGFECAFVVVLAVAEQDENLMVFGIILESGERGFDGSGDVGAALGQRSYVERVQALLESAVVHGQRADEKRHAGETDEAEAVGAGQLHQVLGGELGASKAVGRDVFGQHALGGVNGYNDVQPALLGFLPVEAPLRLRQREDQGNYGGDKQGVAELPARRGDASGQADEQARFDELAQEPLALAPGPDEKGDQRRRHQQEEPEHFRPFKAELVHAGSIVQSLLVRLVDKWGKTQRCKASRETQRKPFWATSASSAPLRLTPYVSQPGHQA